MAKPPADRSFAWLAEFPPAAVFRNEPASIGPYRLLRRLGEGGMGSVWLAEQTGPVKREVAIKLMRSGRFSANDLKRFELERQMLAISQRCNDRWRSAALAG